MKKLMIAAAAAVMVSSAFALCGDDDPVVEASQVYKVTFSGKTTKGLPGSATPVQCGDAVEGCVKRVPAKLVIKGWFALCKPTTCLSLAAGTADAAYKAFWTTKPYKGDIADGDIAFDLVNVIGKKPNKAEAAGKFTGTVAFADAAQWSLGDGLTFAGLGKYNSKKGAYSKIAGNFAGSPAASWYIKGEVCKQSDVYDCATLQMVCEQYPNTVAFGKWNLKYSSSLTKKLAKGKLPKTPSYATISGAEAAQP